ncbi:MAG: glycoside hydrolase family 15 protein [Solirubrobacterales bacterium]
MAPNGSPTASVTAYHRASRGKQVRVQESERGSFPPIAEYGFLSDCHTGALVAPDGSVEWLCLPRFDSPSVFGALLDREAGSFRLGPSDSYAPVSRTYEPGTNVLQTTWATPTGWLVVRDALTIGQWSDEAESHGVHLRPPARHDAGHVLLRTAECIQGEVEVEIDCRAMPAYGREKARWSPANGGFNARVGDLGLRLASTFELSLDDGGAVRATTNLRAGQALCCGLSWGHDDLRHLSVEDAHTRLERTARFWRSWLMTGSFPDHGWRIHLQRSALVLKGLTYAPTGALVAAPTTSLPEAPGGSRNWDYRYTWIRDATFTLWGLHALGFDAEAGDFLQFVAGVCGRDGPDAQIMYGIGGERCLEERTLDHLSGYEGAQPVRIGNAAYKQRQNDVYGGLLDSVYIHSKTQLRLPERLWAVVSDQVEGAAATWREPDQGIWEARGEPKHYVSSKLMCWVALDRGARLARRRGDPRSATAWAEVADEIRGEILDRGVSDRGVFRQHYATDALDASTLLVPLVRFLPAEDPRVHATVAAIADELTEEGLVLRYRVGETDDGLYAREGTFTMCSFWLVSALSEIGEHERAKALCERLLSLAGALNLYAEELEPRSSRHLGNFPQAFTHLALINAVSHVIADDLLPATRERRASLLQTIRARGREAGHATTGGERKG